MTNDINLIDFTVTRIEEALIRGWVKRRPKRENFASQRGYEGALMSWTATCPEPDDVERNPM